MNKFNTAILFTFIYTTTAGNAISGSNVLPNNSQFVQNSEGSALKRPQRGKRSIAINGRKFTILSEQNDHWLLFDPQMSQYCITLNMLVVVTDQLQHLLQAAGIKYQTEYWQPIADNTYRWTGSFSATQQMYQQLKRQPNINLEWQLQYLPLSSKEVR